MQTNFKTNTFIKKTMFLVLSMVMTISIVAAQTQNSVKVNIQFNQIQLITINPSQKTINIEYNTIHDYSNGVESLQKDHLKVFSTSSYEVSVKALHPEIRNVNNTDFIPNSSLQLGIILPKGNSDGISFSTIQVDQLGKNIISSMRPSLETTFDIAYKSTGDLDYIKKVNDGKPTPYSTEIIYTITSK